MTPRRDPGPILQLRVTLDEIAPPVWRRLLVPASATYHQLHRVIQEAFGWWDYHLHVFDVRDERIGLVIPGETEEIGPMADGKKRRLSGSRLVAGERITYTYDFGDDWVHVIDVEAVLESDARLRYPLCIGGARASPPEDSGGPGGYEDLLAQLADPEHEEHDHSLRWVGGFFDPEGFDANAVNARLRRR